MVGRVSDLVFPLALHFHASEIVENSEKQRCVRVSDIKTKLKEAGFDLAILMIKFGGLSIRIPTVTGGKSDLRTTRRDSVESRSQKDLDLLQLPLGFFDERDHEEEEEYASNLKTLMVGYEAPQQPCGCVIA